MGSMPYKCVEASERCVEVGDLCSGVDAGVCATGNGEDHRSPQDGGDGCFDFLLDGGLAFLACPAVVVGAVVGDGEAEAHGDGVFVAVWWHCSWYDVGVWNWFDQYAGVASI